MIAPVGSASSPSGTLPVATISPSGSPVSRSRRTGRPSRSAWAAPSGIAARASPGRRARAAARWRTGPACRHGRPWSCAAATAGPRRRRRARSPRRACRRAARSRGADVRSGVSGGHGDRVARGPAPTRWLAARCSASCSRRNSTSSSCESAGGEARGLPVPAAALGAGDRRHVDAVVARSQRHLAQAGAAVADPVAHERRHLGALDRPQVVDHPLGVALLGVGVREVGGASARSSSAGRRRSARRWPARAPAAPACRRARPRRRGDRPRGRRRRRRSGRRPSDARGGRCSRT